MVHFARTYSNVVSPPVMFAVLGLAISLWESATWWQGLMWAAVYGFWVSLAPILFILWLLKNGRIAELHMSDTRERHLPYISGILLAGVAFAIISLFNGPPSLRCLAMFNVVELMALALVNIVWLISLHSTGATAVSIIAYLIFGTASLWLTVPMVLSVIWVRLYLKRHTPAQVAAGLLLGATSVWLIQQIGCF